MCDKYQHHDNYSSVMYIKYTKGVIFENLRIIIVLYWFLLYNINKYELENSASLI